MFIFQLSSGSEAKGSVGDTDDVMFHDDYDDDAIFDSDVSSTNKLKTLLPQNSSDDADAMIQFQQNFEERFLKFIFDTYLLNLRSSNSLTLSERE